MTFVLLVNDSYFSFLLARPVIERYHREISLVVHSKRIKGSRRSIIGIWSRTYPRYFLYRSLVEAISKVSSKSVRRLATQYGLRSIDSENVNADARVAEAIAGGARCAIAFNFDQLLKVPFLQSFELGVLNTHASKLPDDKGISPVLWAFARGDSEVWSTIYRMDAGIDSGPIFRQFRIDVAQADTAFSLYERVCTISGEQLAEVVGDVASESTAPVAQDGAGTYHGWPDRTHRELMGRSRRRFVRLTQLRRAL